MTLRFLAVISIFTGLFSSCKIQSPEFRRYEQPKVKMQGLQGVKVNTALVFYNPNLVRFKIKKMGFDLYMDGKKIAVINDQPNLVVKPKKEFTVPINAIVKLKLSLAEAIKGISNLFSSKELDLKIVGNLEIRGFMVKRAVSFDVNKKIKLE
jgi:LEA14-like dessication related protein